MFPLFEYPQHRETNITI